MRMLPVGRLALTGMLLVVSGCTGSDPNATSADDGLSTQSDPVAHVLRMRSEVSQSDDFDAFIGIERGFPDGPPCIYLAQPGKNDPSTENAQIAIPGSDQRPQSYASLAILPDRPEEVGEGFIVLNGVRVSNGDRVVGDNEIVGSWSRPSDIQARHARALSAVIEACTGLELRERFGRVFETGPIIFIEEINPDT